MTRFLIALLMGAPLAGCLVVEEHAWTPGVAPVTKHEVMTMSGAGFPDSSILHMIHRNGVAQRPNVDDLVEMKTAGVSGSVMSTMLEAPLRVPLPARESRTVIVRDYSAHPLFLLGVGGLVGYLIGHHR